MGDTRFTILKRKKIKKIENKIIKKQVGDTRFTILKRYQNLKPIGSGAQGIVCAAYDTVLKRHRHHHRHHHHNQNHHRHHYHYHYHHHHPPMRQHLNFPDADRIDAGHAAECGDQEVESTFSKCDACEARVSGVQADEASQPQEHHRAAQLLHPSEVPRGVPRSLHCDGTDGCQPLPGLEERTNKILILRSHLLMSQVINMDLDHERMSYLLYQMLCGIKHLHLAGIIHR